MKGALALRLLVLAGLVGLLEALCRTGVIGRFTMQPPSRMVVDLGRLLASGSLNAAIAKTLGNAAIACLSAILLGMLAAVLIHAIPRLREALDPLFATYYAIPMFAFYPLLIILLGLGSLPSIMIGFMLAIVAVIVNMLNGLDRVPRVLLKTARVARLSRAAVARRITLPFALPYLLTGVKFALAYSLIGVIGSEFIMATEGMGYEIAFAYNNFDNAIMYPLILLVLLVSIALNTAIGAWERRVLARRGGQA
jgi:NitT/TauT family transport system permease protein